MKPVFALRLVVIISQSADPAGAEARRYSENHHFIFAFPESFCGHSFVWNALNEFRFAVVGPLGLVTCGHRVAIALRAPLLRFAPSNSVLIPQD